MNLRIPRGLTVAGSISVLLILAAVLFMMREDAGANRVEIHLPSGALELPSRAAPGTQTNDRQLDAGRSGPASPAPPKISLRVTPGQIFVYDTKYETRTTVRSRAGSEESASLEIRGELERVTYRPIEPGTRLLGYRFSSVQLRNERGPIDSEFAADLIKDLEREVLVEMTERGLIRSFHFSRSMRPSARNRLKGFLNALQIVLPEKRSERWETVETDMTGRYRALYVAASEPPERVRIRKKKEAYLSVNSHEDGASRNDPADTAVIPSGVTEALVNVVDGSLVSLRLEARLEIRDEGPWNGTRLSTHAILEQVSTRTDREVAMLSSRKLAKRLSGMDVSEAGAVDEAESLAEDARRSGLRELAGQDSVTDLALELSSLLKRGGERSREAYELMRRLAALIELDEANASVARVLLRSGQLAGTSANFVAGALGSAGTPAAQAVLADLLMESDFGPGFRSSCLVALSSAEKPSEKAEWALRTLADEIDTSDLDGNALLVLGVMANRLADSDGARSLDIANFILDREDPMQSTGRIRTFLDALGNAGIEESYATIERYVDDERASTRAAAIAALRRVEHDGVDVHLQRALDDASATVRLAAIETLGSRPTRSEHIPLVGETALQAPETRVRRAAVEFLGERIDQAGSRELLERISASESDGDVRRMAAEYLQGA